MAKAKTSPTLTPTAPVVLQVADAPTSPTSIKEEKKKRAEHDLLSADGLLVDDEEDANGIRYTLLELPNRPFTYQFGANAAADKLLALFGAKTLCTNESSAVRNSPKGSGSADEQIEAVEGRFALLTTGKWVDRTREGGARIDLDRLANAMCNVMVVEGKYTEEDVKGGKLAATRQKLDDDKAFARAAGKHPPFAAEYARLGGAASVTIDDFAV